MNNFPFNTVYLDSVDSTNSFLKRIIKETGLPSGLAVMAKKQTCGRGRLGREWLSNEDNTLCMSAAIKAPYSEGITLLVALAVQKALKPFCGVFSGKLLIKWPNDIICDNKKLSGILCERIGEYTVIGVGVNVNDKGFCGELRDKATSLYMLSEKENDVKEVFRAITIALESELLKYGFIFTAEAKSEYESLCANLGRKVTTASHCATAVGIGDNGSLLIKTDEELIAVTSGEVAVHGIY